MPKARIPMSKIREIIRLHQEAGMSIRMISRALRISRPAVDHYLVQAGKAQLKWSDVKTMSDDELLQRLQQAEEKQNDPRYLDLVERLPNIVAELGKKHVTRQLLWEEYRRKVHDGYGYTQFCYHLQMFTADSQLSMHLEHEPGKRMFLDYAGDKPHLVDPKTGIEHPVELFVAVLPASGLTYLEAVNSQKIEDFLCATRHALEYAGGVPTILVPDNLKAAVTKADRYEPDINQTFEDFGRYYGCVVIPARPAKPRDKALVEAAVNLVYTRVMAPLRGKSFATLDEMNEAMWEQLELLNNREMKRIRLSRRQRFDAIEREQLSPLPTRPYTLRRFIDSVTVQMNYHVYFSVDKHYYSVPYSYRRKKVRIAYSEREIEIYSNNRRIAAHRRDRRPYQYTTDNDHMPSQHRFMSEWNPARFLRWAAQIGEQTQVLIDTVLRAREVPEQAYRSCMGILNLGKKTGNERLEAACRRANHFGIDSYRGVKRILDRGLESQRITSLGEQPVLAHQNVRGGEYYALGNRGDRS